MNDGQDPLFAGDGLLQLPDQLEVVLKHLADLKHLLLAGEHAVPEITGELDVE